MLGSAFHAPLFLRRTLSWKAAPRLWLIPTSQRSLYCVRGEYVRGFSTSKASRSGPLLPRRSSRTVRGGPPRALLTISTAAQQNRVSRQYSQLVQLLGRLAARHGGRLLPKAAPFLIFGLTRVLPLLALVAVVTYLLWLLEHLSPLARRFASVSLLLGGTVVWLGHREWTYTTQHWQQDVLSAFSAWAGTDDILSGQDHVLYLDSAQRGTYAVPLRLEPRSFWLWWSPGLGLHVLGVWDCLLGPRNSLCNGHSIRGTLQARGSLSLTPPCHCSVLSPSSSCASCSSSSSSASSCSCEAGACSCSSGSPSGTPHLLWLCTDSLVFLPFHSNQVAATKKATLSAMSLSVSEQLPTSAATPKDSGTQITSWTDVSDSEHDLSEVAPELLALHTEYQVLTERT
eukprot:gb/GEZN01008326.1/.p1 GENE.gb/GEZN01008326.1/~~gb/GEZN01008326.1/.p1  ORF type:complete len:399 (+),score=41.71 gb/GEZN01008326.1/:54-1250(+)